MSGASDRTRHQVIKDLFLAALDIESDIRELWLRDAVEGDATLFAEVSKLLASHQAAEDGSLLDNPVLDRGHLVESNIGPGSSIGPWLLGSLIGTGGMGSVYRASRADGTYERTVALKVVQHGSEVVGISDRFATESNTLARLEHPNIARLYDAGVSSEKIPYLVMEYVDGVPVTTYVQEHKCSIPESLVLFLEICEAVSYAHRNLVVHRDLKPSNILVSSSGNVKLLDFGIALLLDAPKQRLASSSGSAMTPAYAAPEQVGQDPVTTATDTYSLGVLLYEMLAGTRPYDLSGLEPAEMQRIVCTVTPEKPSEAAQDGHRQRGLKGDLDAIIMKSLRKSPVERYSTTQALIDDLERYLSGDPVRARSGGAVYRVNKFVRRNRVPVAATLVVLVAIVAGLISTIVQAQRVEKQRDTAEQRFDIARQATSGLMFEVHDAIANLSGSTPARELIVRQALDYLAQLNETAGSDVQLRVDMANAYRRIGDVLGNPSNNNLGRVQEALESYRKGLAILPENADPDSLMEGVTFARALLFEKLGDVMAHTGELDSALVYLDNAIGFYKENADAHPEEPGEVLPYAIGNIKRGDYTGNPHFPNAGDAEGAMTFYKVSLHHLQRLEQGSNVNTRVLRYLGLIFERIGTIQADLGDLEISGQSYVRSMEYREELSKQNPNDMTLHRDAGIAHEKVGLTYQMQGELDSAWRELQIAHKRYAELVEVDPENVNARITLAVSEMQLGALMSSTSVPSYGDRGGSRLHYQRARKILEGVLEIDASNTRVLDLLDTVNSEMRRL